MVQVYHVYFVVSGVFKTRMHVALVVFSNREKLMKVVSAKYGNKFEVRTWRRASQATVFFQIIVLHFINKQNIEAIAAFHAKKGKI